MDLFTSIFGPFAALAGVWIGGWLATRSARQTAELERQRRSLEELRRVYSAYLTACRQFVDYLKQPANKVEAVRSATGDLDVPILSPDGAALRQSVEAASADLLLQARSQAIVEQARLLRVGMIRVAIARAASSDGIISSPNLVAFRRAEQAYINAVRDDLGLPPMDVTLWTKPTETRPIPRDDQPGE